MTGPGYVSKTVVLYNESVQPGTVPAYPVSGVDALALDTANHHLWVVGYNLGSLNLTTGLEDMGELGGTYSTSATHLLYVPSTDQILEMFVTGGNVSVYWANNGTYVRNLTLPGGPYDASFDPATKDIFLVNQGGNNVSVMNASSLTTAKWVTVGSSPQQAAYDPLDHAMFVSVSAGHVSIINDTNLTVTAVPLPQTSGGGSGDPTGLVYDPANGSVLVSEYNLGRLAVLNASTGAYEMLVKTLAYPGYLAYDGANGGVYVLNWFGDSLNILNSTLASVSNGSASATAPPVYDPADGWMLVAAGGVERFNASSDVRISRLLPSQQAPWGMAYDATNSSVFVVGSSGPSSNAGVVSAWNSSTGAFEGSLGFNETNEPVDAAYDSGTAEVYVSDQGSSWIAAWNATYPYALVNQTYVGENPTGMAVDPRRDRLVVAEVQSKNVEVLTASNLSVVANVTVGWNPTDVVYVPITDQYYVADSGSNNLSIINASTLNVITNVSVGGCPFDETYDSASQTVLVTDSCTNSVTAVNVTTHAARSVPVGGSPEGVAFDSVTGGSTSRISTRTTSPSSMPRV